VTLQRLSGLAVDSDDHTVGITGQVHADLDLDLAQFLFNLLLLLGLAPLDIRTELTRYAGDFIEEGEFSLVEVTLFNRET
jgi:hypothetical protein